ncbi:MAG: undecaprenyl-diphosphatase, partial [Lentilactobacillus hilgardii]
LAIRFVLNNIKNNKIKIFGWYRIVLSLIVIAYFGLIAR